MTMTNEDSYEKVTAMQESAIFQFQVRWTTN